jgi:Holliday junction resolvase RusA-like endonuclease
MYNPSAEAQDSFRKVVRELLLSKEDNDDDAENFPTIFPTQSLVMTIAFRMKRPKKHFSANRPGTGRLRATAPPQTSAMRSDVDNLAKFVLDSLNGMMYEDDRQVCSLHVTKFLDNEDYCLGATEVCVRVLDDADLPNLLDNSFDLF